MREIIMFTLVLIGIISSTCLARTLEEQHSKENFGFRSLRQQGTIEDAVIRDDFDVWYKIFGNDMATLEDRERRFKNFKRNVDHIRKHNSLNKSYKLDLNKFAGYSNEEFRHKYLTPYLSKAQPSSARRKQHSTKGILRDTVSLDWRDKGAVTEVKDQGECGSCWAFSAVATIESANRMAGNDLVELSEQELIDCDKPENLGCGGGMMDNAYQYIIERGGISLESDYPYSATDGQCALINGLDKVHITSYSYLNTSSEQDLLSLVGSRPVSAAIIADGIDFQLYSGGIFSGDCGLMVDHAIAVIGFGSDTEGDFWIIKNSWGVDWGEGGYARLARNVGDGAAGTCAITSMVTYPVM